MDTARCPACNAVVTNGADWCSLCYADLRPRASAASVAAAAAPPAAPAAPAAAQAPTVPGAAVSVAVATLPAPDEQAPAAAAAPRSAQATGQAAWPCSRCGASVPIERDTCPECGAGFLAGGDSSINVPVPGLGNLAAANTGIRLTVGLVAAGVIGLVFLLVMFVLGKLF